MGDEGLWELVVLGGRSGGGQTPGKPNLCVISYCSEDITFEFPLLIYSNIAHLNTEYKEKKR